MNFLYKTNSFFTFNPLKTLRRQVSRCFCSASRLSSHPNVKFLRSTRRPLRAVRTLSWPHCSQKNCCQREEQCLSPPETRNQLTVTLVKVFPV